MEITRYRGELGKSSEVLRSCHTCVAVRQLVVNSKQCKDRGRLGLAVGLLKILHEIHEHAYRLDGDRIVD